MLCGRQGGKRTDSECRKQGRGSEESLREGWDCLKSDSGREESGAIALKNKNPPMAVKMNSGLTHATPFLVLEVRSLQQVSGAEIKVLAMLCPFWNI